MEPQKISITICGDGGTGKSSITLRLFRSHWTSEYDPTIEDSYSISRNIDGSTYILSLTDTAGQEEYRGMWAHSNLESDAFLLVYDITSRESLDALEEYDQLIEIEGHARTELAARTRELQRANMQRKKSLRRRNRHTGTPSVEKAAPHDDYPIIKPIKIVAGNKCDLAQARAVSSRQGLDWARRHHAGFMETSARNVVNIEETFALIVRRVVQARQRAVALNLALREEMDDTLGSVDGLHGGRYLGVEGTSEAANFEASMYIDHSVMGTRRAMTRPLSPLRDNSWSRSEKWASEREKERAVMGARERWKRFWGQMKSWMHN